MPTQYKPWTGQELIDTLAVLIEGPGTRILSSNISSCKVKEWQDKGCKAYFVINGKFIAPVRRTPS